MKFVWPSILPILARPQDSSGRAGWVDDRNDPFRLSGERFSAGHMKHRCDCGMSYLVIPKEIPLAKGQQLTCDNCRSALHGRWSSRYFDYKPFRIREW